MQHPKSLSGGTTCCAARMWVEREEAHNPAHRARSMQDAGYGLRRIIVLRTWVKTPQKNGTSSAPIVDLAAIRRLNRPKAVPVACKAWCRRLLYFSDGFLLAGAQAAHGREIARPVPASLRHSFA